MEFLQLSGCTLGGAPPQHRLTRPAVASGQGNSTWCALRSQGEGEGKGGQERVMLPLRELENKAIAKVSRKDNQTLHISWLCARFTGGKGG